ncbi:MAG: BrnT family toxin [Verrucomicrobia bacterium]|nr:BrnT family toxin [Verrucomicrobiota bacterium]MDA1065987.1 BrnT family toxin [Verrucomicrobiota bacterium]
MWFEWDLAKEKENLAKHGVDFSTVGEAWSDPDRLIFRNPGMTRDELRYQFTGFDGTGILTVRFTMRSGNIRVIGAGYWRKQKRIYEKQSKAT